MPSSQAKEASDAIIKDSSVHPEAFHVKVGDMSFCVETRGNPKGEPVLFIMGLGAQMTLWPEGLLDKYADEGYRVIRFDNRDIGLSTHLTDRLEGHPLAVMARARMGLSVPAPYTLRDMALDVVGLLDQLGIAQCHFVGVSMGGMISQLVAANHPERVKSLTLIMTSTNSPKLPMPKPQIILKLAGIGAKGHDEESVLKRSLNFWKTIQSPGFPASEDKLAERIISNYRRSYHPAGILRQTRAVLATGSFAASTRRIRVPTAIIHGNADPLVRVAASEQLAYLIPHASLDVIEGMGHDLPEPLFDRFLENSLRAINETA